MSDFISSLLPLHRISLCQSGGLRKELLTLLEKICTGLQIWRAWGRKLNLLVQGIKTLQTMKSQIPIV